MSAVDGGLRPLFRRHFPKWHWQSIETGSTSQGVPDSNYCWDRTEGWVEFKQTHGWVVRFKPTQIGWILRRTRAGGRVFVAVRQWKMSGDLLHDTLWLVPGHLTADLATGGLKSVALGSLIIRGPRWDWDQIGQRLLAVD